MKRDRAILVELLAKRPTLSRKDLQRFFGRSESTIDHWHKTGLLPPAHYLRGGRSPFWTAWDIRRYITK